MSTSTPGSLLLHILEVGQLPESTSPSGHHCTCEIVAHRKIGEQPSNSNNAAAATVMPVMSSQVIDLTTIPSTVRDSPDANAPHGGQPIIIKDLKGWQETDYVEIHVLRESGESLGRVTVPVTGERMFESGEVWNVW